MVTMPPEWDANELLPHALARRVAFVPGAEFHLDGSGRNTFRLNFSNATPAQIEKGVFLLAEALGEKRKAETLNVQDVFSAV